MSERTAVYEFVGDADALLYVGVTNALGRRWDEHAKAQPWWLEVQRQTVAWYADRETAEQAEKATIKAAHPRYNIAHSVDPQTGLPVIAEIIGNGDWRESGRIGLTAVRAELAELVATINKQHSCVLITSRWTPTAAMVPASLGAAILAAGGPDAVLKILSDGEDHDRLLSGPVSPASSTAIPGGSAAFSASVTPIRR